MGSLATVVELATYNTLFVAVNVLNGLALAGCALPGAPSPH
jgi:hypothetical protein